MRVIHSVSLPKAFQTTVSNGHTSTTTADVPKAKGGEGQGFGAHELLEAALAACLNMTIRMTASKNAMVLHRVETQVRLDQSVSGHTQFVYSIDLDGELDDAQRTLLFEAASRCAVVNTLTGHLSVCEKARASEES